MLYQSTDIMRALLTREGWTESGIVALEGVRDRNHANPLEETRESGHLHWWRWLVDTQRFLPSGPVRRQPPPVFDPWADGLG